MTAAITIGLALLQAAPAHAQIDLVSRNTISAFAEFRVTAADGERSWIRSGQGKTAASGGGDDIAVRPSLAEADIIWKPTFGWNLGGTLVGQYQPAQTKPLGVSEAFVTFRPTPTGPLRQQVRVGLFWPPISQEHGGATWAVSDSITPSAINSWVGEEVKVVGAEYSLNRSFDYGGELGATLGVFGFNDTSGTLLTFRGWALHDLKSTHGADLPLPAMTAFLRNRQAAITTPSLEIDDRAGFYGRVDWRPVGNVSLNAFYYDNLGNPTSPTGAVASEKQWAWDTRFWNLGASIKLGDNTRIKTQYLQGVTLMGFSTPQIWIDLDYQSAYALLSHTFGDRVLTGRVDYFETGDNSWKTVDNNAEHGLAAMLAWRQPINQNLQWLVEAQQVWSTRADRARFGVAPTQSQTVISSALRVSF